MRDVPRVTPAGAWWSSSSRLVHVATSRRSGVVHGVTDAERRRRSQRGRTRMWLAVRGCDLVLCSRLAPTRGGSVRSSWSSPSVHWVDSTARRGGSIPVAQLGVNIALIGSSVPLIGDGLPPVRGVVSPGCGSVAGVGPCVPIIGGRLS